jgi:hypothetical protein
MRPQPSLSLAASIYPSPHALQPFGGGKIVSFDQCRFYATTQKAGSGKTTWTWKLPCAFGHAPWWLAWPLVSVNRMSHPEIDLLIVDGLPAVHPHVRGAASSLFPLIPAPAGGFCLMMRHGQANASWHGAGAKHCNSN